MKHRCSLLLLWSFAVLLALATPVVAQTPSPNADILKMIQAGLPEDSIVDKIRENTGHWDTSIDALIALKQAGATDAEIKALTVAPPAPIAAAPEQPIFIAGGQLLHTREGDPYLQFPQKVGTIFPNFEPSNIARLVSYQGKPAIAVQAEHLEGKTIFSVSATNGYLLITKDEISFSGYLTGVGYYPKDGKFKLTEADIKALQADSWSIPTSQVKFANGTGYAVTTHATSFDKKHGKFNVGWQYVFSRGINFTEPGACENDACSSIDLQAFVSGLIHDFDNTLKPLLDATGITEADKQLSPAAHFQPAKTEDYPKYAAIYQAQLNHAPHPSGGGFWDGFSQVAQVASAGTTMLQQVQAGGDPIAAQAQYNQTIASIGSGSSPAPYVPPATATPAAAAKTQPTPAAAPAGKSSFNFHQPKPIAAPRPAAAPIAATSPTATDVPAPAIASTPTSNAQGGCATSPSGSNLPLAPGTTASTCTPAACRDMGLVVHLDSHWKDATKTEVVAYWSNHSIAEATCTYAFHKPDGTWGDGGTGYLKAGAEHQGGELAGMFSTIADSTTIKYKCYEGVDPVDAQGRMCTSMVVFSGPTLAGTDR